MQCGAGLPVRPALRILVAFVDRLVFVDQGAPRGAIEIVELTGPKGPKEGDKPDQTEKQRNGYEQHQPRHAVAPLGP